MRVRSRALGWLPVYALVSGLALVVIALADNGARLDRGWAAPAFWAALIVMFMSIAGRLLATAPSRDERLGLVIILGMALYMVAVMRRPDQLLFFQEFSAGRTGADILRSHHLFSANPLAPVNPAYPGLETVVSPLAGIGDMRMFTAGNLLLGVARIVLMIALFLVVERMTDSAGVAGIASLIYLSNPNFLLFDSNFSYESLALPLGMLALLALISAARPSRGRRGLLIAALILIEAVVVTHHITSYALTLLLIGWGVLALGLRRRGRLPYPWIFAVVGLASAVCWAIFVAPSVSRYLVDVLGPAGSAFTDLVSGQTTAKTPFRSGVGTIAPLWERTVGFGSVALLLISLAFGLVHVWQRHRSRSLVGALTVAAVLYPFSLALRLTQAGTETSNRASEFLFLGLAVVVGLVVSERWLVARHERPSRALLPALALGLTVVFVGGITVGTAPFERLPGRYLVGADSRSVDQEGVSAAQWTDSHLGVHRRILTDRTNRQLMGYYALADPQLRSGGPVPGVSYVHVSDVLFSPTFGPVQRRIVRNRRLQYLVADRRLATALPLVGIYFERSEPDAYSHRQPIGIRALTKFDRVAGVGRTFDSGNLILYDVRSVATGRTP